MNESSIQMNIYYLIFNLSLPSLVSPQNKKEIEIDRMSFEIFVCVFSRANNTSHSDLETR